MGSNSASRDGRDRGAPDHRQRHRRVSNRAVDVLRDDLVPATVGQVADVEAYTTGDAAATGDFNDAMIGHLPSVFAFVLSAAFLLLLVTFRSLVIPIKAIVLNLLSWPPHTGC
jgi:predicted RND superfamily exporter protein